MYARAIYNFNILISNELFIIMLHKQYTENSVYFPRVNSHCDNS